MDNILSGIDNPMDTLPIGVLFIDDAGKYIYQNSTSKKLHENHRKIWDGFIRKLIKVTENEGTVIQHRENISDQNVVFSCSKKNQIYIVTETVLNKDISDNLDDAVESDSSTVAVSEDIVYRSRKMDTLITTALKVADMDVTVLIQGESGTGKEVVAKLIHKKSNRRNHRFVAVNCGAIPGNLLESELFGYVKGAFTGSSEEGKPGLFELADKGTLFLDEIGALPLNLQTKLLRAIHEKEIMRLGDNSKIKVDLRIIAATNVDLSEAVRREKFREDLYYRLNVIPIVIPPLRDRMIDVYPLTGFFLERFNKKYNSNKKLTEDAWASMMKYQWPGNVRELENIVERLVVTMDSDEINGNHINGMFHNLDFEDTFETQIGSDLKSRVEEYEKKLIKSQLQYYKRSQELADALGVNKSTLTRKMKRYRIKNIYYDKDE